MTDNDPRAVTLSTTALPLYEDSMGAGTGTYTVVLDTAPTAPVTITVRSGDETAVSRAPAVLTFTADTGNTAQTVAVRADADTDGRAD